MAKRPLKTLIVVADGARARFFRPEADKLVHKEYRKGWSL